MTKQQIINRTKYWQKRFGLENWKIDVYIEDFNGNEEGEFVTVAKTDAHPTYMLATITFKKKYLFKVSNTIIIHELLHVVLGEIHSYMITSPKELLKSGNYAQHHIEKTISTIERIIERLKK